MSQYKISKKRLAQIIKEEYDAAMLRTDEGHGAFGFANRDEDDEPKSKKKKKDERTDEAHCATNRDEDKKDKKKIKNPGPYIDGERSKAGVDDDGDGVPNNADPHPRDGSKKKMNKESLDSIRDLIQQELKNL
tara:strand:+ start:747 stop:1145 length:399 start_codon:yes stop_codon:yes gene_type:complete